MTIDETSVSRAPALVGKADFSELYVRPDPNALFDVLSPLQYQVPQHALPVIEQVLARGGGGTVLDVCCSYGLNAALLCHDLDLVELGKWMTAPERQALSTAEIIEQDRAMFARRRRRTDLCVLGLDTSGPAVEYARRAELIANGWSEDLECDAPSEQLAQGITNVDVLVCTGGVGYVGASTFDHIFRAIARPSEAWVVASVLRAVDYRPIANALRRYGLQTRKVPGGPVRQRQFISAEEATSAVAQAVSTGHDVAGLEESGWFYADIYVSGASGFIDDLRLNSPSGLGKHDG